MFIYLLLFWSHYSLAMISDIDNNIHKKYRSHALACDFCRKRHQKCVRINKSCANCLKHHQECINSYAKAPEAIMKNYDDKQENINLSYDKLIYRHKFWFEENIDNFLE